MINLTIDGINVQAEEGMTVLEAAKKAGISIPTLCYLKGINEIGACRVCVVEVERMRNLQASCTLPVSEGMVVRTNSPRVREARRINVELMLSDHPQDCLVCARNQNCELQKLAHDLGIREVRFQAERKKRPVDQSTPSIIRDPNKCVLCRRCVAVCSKVQGVSVLSALERGIETVIAPAWQEKLDKAACTLCGQCTAVCPTGALVERDYIDEVWEAISDPGKHVVVQTAPAVRVAVGEGFGMEPGTPVVGKMVTALRLLGFDKVFDTDFTADLTIVEEANELLQRLENGGTVPMITSCSPGWIKFIEHYYPDLLSHLSTCKSPQQMFGALAKTYYAEKSGIDPAQIVTVSIMPCTAKKYEAMRPEMNSSGYQDVDYVLTTRELIRMIKQAGINFNELPDSQFDAPLGISTGAGVIFGNTGGVMEAALRTAYEAVTKKTLSRLEFADVRGLEGIKEAEVDLNGVILKVAVAHSLSNARKLMEKIRAGEANYHFIEIMACPGGCISGGGQPIPTDDEVRQKRMAGIYSIDEAMTIRKSHENPAVIALYKEFLEKPLGHKSHQFLHTRYKARGKLQNSSESSRWQVAVVSNR